MAKPTAAAIEKMVRLHYGNRWDSTKVPLRRANLQETVSNSVVLGRVTVVGYVYVVCRSKFNGDAIYIEEGSDDR